MVFSPPTATLVRLSSLTRKGVYPQECEPTRTPLTQTVVSRNDPSKSSQIAEPCHSRGSRKVFRYHSTCRGR
ncbi:hypothetical protein AB1Y20_022352 [Prymnesium parvum]|uniref:Uncharacterized protein n=1 Tax=Prymnesium parvum TaxID=97485 RepID=A0AB34JGX3_PRYPA